MERKGYDEQFDPMEADFMPTKSEAAKIELEEIYAKRLNKLPMNIIECIVGIALLILCYNYIQTHPAEKSSLITGVEVLMQKFRINISNMTNGQGDDVDRKYRMENSLQEILNLAENGGCLNEVDTKKVQAALENIQEMTLDTFLKQEGAYDRLANIYYNKAKANCQDEDTNTDEDDIEEENPSEE